VEPLVATIAERHPDVEVDVQEGGQPHYPLLLSAE
jgi:dihydroxyacetone kinase-like predicted kinase